MKAIVRSLATANPPMYVTQKEAFEGYDAYFNLAPEERELYRRILVDGPIKGRYVGMDDKRDACETNQDRLLERFLKFARLTCNQAARRALEDAGLAPGDVCGLVTNTCTGYLCPGLSSYLVQDLGLPTSLRVFDLMGMGCGAAIPNLECAAGAIARDACGPVLSVAFEICSSTIFMGPEPDLVVSNSIFGDGAAAAVLDSAPDGDDSGLFRLVDFDSGLFPKHREELRYRSKGGRLRNVLSRRVPVIGARAVAHVAHRLLERRNLSPDEIDWWAVHPGGTVVLDRVADKLDLSRETLRFSYDVFREYGNMSSPSVLFVLKKILNEGKPRRGDKGLLLSFGAGFTAFAALVEF